MADQKIACPAPDCNYAGTYRMGQGEPGTYVGWMADEHPKHPAMSGIPRNVKPKTLHTEMLLDEDGELNF